jgi:Ca2+-binding RTX toxin-like protein
MKAKVAGALVTLVVGWLVVAIAPPARADGFGQITGTVSQIDPFPGPPGDSFNVPSNGADAFTAAEGAAASFGNPAVSVTADASLAYQETFQGTDLTSLFVNGSAAGTVQGANPLVLVFSQVDSTYGLDFRVSQDVPFSLAGSLSLVATDGTSSVRVGLNGQGVAFEAALQGPTDSTLPVSTNGTLVPGNVYAFFAVAETRVGGPPDSAALASLDVTLTLGAPPPAACDNTFSEQADVIVGTEFDDRLCGGGGDDVIQGLGGNDTILGGGGFDRIAGGLGDDTILGGDDGDRIGDPGASLVGNDTIEGGGGNDIIDGSLGNDIIDAGDGNDQIVGTLGNDIIEGGGGDDTIRAGRGNDVVQGGDDDDTIDGEEENDTIDGGDGADTIGGGDGADTIFGGSNLITGGDGNDLIDGGGGGDDIFGGAGDDDIFGGFDNGSDTLTGGNGNDLIDGGRGFDTIDGGEGNDRLFAADGSVDGVDGGNGLDQARADRKPLDVVNNVEKLRRI